MKISLSALKKYVDIPVPTDELISLIGSRLVEVESVEDLSFKYQGIYIVKVVKCQEIPNTHLHLCNIDAGSALNSKFSADSDPTSPIQVVCGAPNVKKGILAVWITPGSIVPSTFGHENFELSIRKIRGFESFGMLAGADELALGDDHSGIVEIAPDFAKPGDNFAEKFDLNDVILDIENKSLTHRPDTFGLIGFAREVAGILGQPFKNPDFFSKSLQTINESQISIEISDFTLCPRYTCAILEYLDQPSPYLTPDHVTLFKAGMRPISQFVDLTNLTMLETGQPLHAFDFDKFIQVGGTKQPKITIRAAKPNEELTLLDGKTIKCAEHDILIASNNIPVALAGAMGGLSTAIDKNTTRILLESATFSLYNLRKTQMKHGIFSEAITRFTKGQPAGLSGIVLQETINQIGSTPILISDSLTSNKSIPNNLTSSSPTSDNSAINTPNQGPQQNSNLSIQISTRDINQLLGTDYSTKLIVKTLKNVGISVNQTADNLEILPPFWRTDLHIKEDIIEEVGRLLGYDNIAQTLPTRPFTSAHSDQILNLKSRLRSILADRLSSHELLTYSFVHKGLLEKVEQNPDESYEIINSISPDLQYFRQSITPSLLEKTYDNLKSGHKNFTLFEFNQISRKSDGLNSEKVPNLRHSLAILTVGDYYSASHLLNSLVRDLLNLQPEFQATTTLPPYFEPLHSAIVQINHQTLGHIGEIKQIVLNRFKIKETISVIEIDLELLAQIQINHQKNLKISRFPSVERAITAKVNSTTQYTSILENIESTLASLNLIHTVTPSSIYQSEETSKNLSFNLKFSSPDQTLDNMAISDIMNTITTNLVALGAQII